jgi:hypothetical protein
MTAAGCGWVMEGGPDFPEVGDPVELVHDARQPGHAERWSARTFPLTLGVGWTSPAGLLITAGTPGALLS